MALEDILKNPNTINPISTNTRIVMSHTGKLIPLVQKASIEWSINGDLFGKIKLKVIDAKLLKNARVAKVIDYQTPPGTELIVKSMKTEDHGGVTITAMALITDPDKVPPMAHLRYRKEARMAKLAKIKD